MNTDRNSLHPYRILLAVLIGAWCPCLGLSAGCEASPILFAYRGSLLTVSPGHKPTEVASGLHAPSYITWAPGCRHFAFIDSGSLWIGEAGVRPSRLVLPSSVLRYKWGPGGEAIAITVSPSGRGCQGRSAAYADEGETYIATLRNRATRAANAGCRSYVLAWTANGRWLLLYQQALGLCPITVPICPTGNVVALNLRSDARTTLVSARYLRKKKLGDPEIIKWLRGDGVLYAWSMITPIGGLGLLFAQRVPSGQMLWSMGSYEAIPLTHDRLASLNRKITDLEKTGSNWEWQYGIIYGGRVAAEYPSIPTSGDCGIALDGRYIWWQPTDSEREIHFATMDNADIWHYHLPSGFQSEDEVWTPSDSLAVRAYKKSGDTILLRLWLLDPVTKTAIKVFEGTSPLKPSAAPIRTAHRALPLASWAR